MRKWFKLLALVAFLTGLVFLARGDGVSQKLFHIRDWVAMQGAWGPFLFIGVYVLSTIAAIPASALTIVAGAVFGSVVGVLTVTVGAMIGAAICFLMARYMAREAIVSVFGSNAHFKRLDDLTASHGAIIVVITRLIPFFPFNVLNYGFGLTSISFRTYVLWTFLGMLPGTILYVVGSDVVATTLQEGCVPWLLVGIIIFTLILLLILILETRRKLKQESIFSKESENVA